MSLRMGVIVLSFCASLTAQEIPLKDWAVPFEQLRGNVAETHPIRIGDHALRPDPDAVPSAASHFITMVPCRVLDTRNANGPFGGPIMGQGETRTYNVPAGPCAGIPTNASAYSLNFSVTNTAGQGYLTTWPAGATQPLAATMTWFAANQTLTTAAIVPAGTSASISVFAAQTAHVVIDINGYFVEGVVTQLNPGTGMAGGGTGNVTIGLAPGGVTNTEVAGNSVSTTTIQDNAVTTAKFANGQAVKALKGLRDVVDITGVVGTSVSMIGNSIQISASAALPAGTTIIGDPGDTSLITAGFTEIDSVNLEGWKATSLTNAPLYRDTHTAVWTGTKMIVWGGITQFIANTGGQYDPATDSWT